MSRSWVKRTCKQCSKEFEIAPRKIRSGNGIFCSKRCFHLWNQGSNHYGWNSLIRNCEICGREFVVKCSQVKIGKGRFCSKICQSMWQSESKKGPNNPRWGKRSEKQNKEKVLKKKPPHQRVKKICQQCQREFEIIPSAARKGGGRFCSRECRNKYQRGPNHPQWKGGQFQRPSSKADKYKAAKLDRPGLIYLLHADNGLFKIGRTRKILERIIQLEIQLPYELELTMIIQSEDMYWLETELHQHFAEKRRRGEWFELSQYDLGYIKRFALAMTF